MGVDIAFWVCAVGSVGAALAVVLLKDLFRAALCLVLCLLMVAGLYVTLNADLLAGLQVLVYVGAIALLIVFAVMFTRDARQGGRFNKMVLPVALVSLLLMGAMIASVADKDNFGLMPGDEIAELREAGPEEGVVGEEEPTAGAIGEFLFSQEKGYLLILEIAGALLLASVLGALVLVRERDK